jgi:hypothetical protein
MLIAVQRGMSSIKRQLEHRGHKVVYSDEISYPVDVIINKGSKHDMTNSASPELSGTTLHHHKHHGIIEINAEGKSIRDIEMMLFAQRHDNTHLLS